MVMEEDRICSVFGHRNVAITDELYAKTKAEIIQAIDGGCRVFYFGGFGDFDELCYQIVTSIKNERTDISLKRVYCVSQERYLRKNSPHFRREDYDEVIYLIPSFDGWYKSIYFRNCAMIDNSDVIIFYADDRENSGAYKAYKYAKKKKDKRVINLFGTF